MLKILIAGAMLAITLTSLACGRDSTVATTAPNDEQEVSGIATIMPIAKQASASTKQQTPTTINETPAPPTLANQRPTKPARTLVPQVRLPTVQIPSPAEPEEHDHTSFLDRLETEEKDCLPEHVSNDEQVVGLMAQMDKKTTRDTMQCLSDEAQFELHLLTAEDKALARETQRCLWAGQQPLTAHQDLGPQSPQYDRTTYVKFLAPVVIELYCKGTDPAWQGLQVTGSDERIKPQINSVYCIVDAKGAHANSWTGCSTTTKHSKPSKRR